MSDKFKNEWTTIDSLWAMGLPKSASEKAQLVLDKAKTGKDYANVIKAQLFLLAANDDNEENATEKNIALVEGYIDQSVGAEKALWQSIVAEMYWSFYQNNRWQILKRTTLENNTSNDIATWDARSFYKKVAELFTASIEQRELLKAIPVDYYTPIIIQGINTRHLRPTLYDLLVFRAIGFFKNDEKELTNAADKFQIDGKPWFDPADKFAEVKVKVKNSDALHFTALRLYQEVIAFHLKDKEPDALIDADLQRLSFVYAYSISPSKDSLYVEALRDIVQKYPLSKAVAQAKYLIAAQQTESTRNTNRRGGTKKTADKSKNNRLIAQELQAIIKDYTGTEGASNAQNLLNELQYKTLHLQVEDVNLKQEAFRILLSYKNTPEVFFSLYQNPNFNRFDDDYGEADTFLSNLNKRTPVRKWKQLLPATEDMDEHSTELKIDALENGSYILIASIKEDITSTQNVIVKADVIVSNIALVKNSVQKKAYVLDRKTGKPIANATITFWNQKYNNKTYKSDLVKFGSAKTVADGSFNLLQYTNYNQSVRFVTIKSGNDSLMLDGSYNVYKSSVNEEKQRYTTFLFTDRALYRPGQTIYYKGIVVKSTNGNKTNDVVPNYATQIEFKDANYQNVSSKNVITNEFGSFSGSFTAPDNGLTGFMQISNQHGSVSFNVEEYKRPKFQVSFDPIKASYALNETVNVTGTAKAYAGNNIDGASVSYRVVRRIYFPYYWRCYYWGYTPNYQEVEITNGTAITDANGNFDVSFTTVPDKSVQPETLPTFTYQVYADVTDINGETRSGNTSLSCGYTSLQIAAFVDEKAQAKDLKSIIVSTKNLNDVFIPAQVQLSISKLAYPGFYRKRLWQQPDQFVLSEKEFHSLFPEDEYKDEANYMNWKVGDPIYKSVFTTTADGQVSIPENTWQKSGWYVITLTAKDAQGNEIIEKKYTHVWNTGKNQNIELPILAISDQSSYQPGDKALMWMATAIEKPHLLRTSTKTYTGTQPMAITIDEADRGGLTYSWLYLYNNRVYTTTQTLNIPWSNKDLKIEWATYRDKLLPGAKETWTMTIKGPKKDKVAAELLAGMFDASLDAFKPHSWAWQKLFPYAYANPGWEHYAGFSIKNFYPIKNVDLPYSNYQKEYDALVSYIYRRRFTLGDDVIPTTRFSAPVMKKNMEVKESAAPQATGSSSEMFDRMEAGNVGYSSEDARHMVLPPIPDTEGTESATNTSPEIQVRSNLNETAFFLPQLHTDADGNVQVQFTMPEALIEWRLMTFAHTKDWKTGYTEARVKTQKDLMVVPNLPRFFRQKDELLLSAKVSNLSSSDLNGIATLEILDAATLQPVLLAFGLKNNQQSIILKPGQSTTAQWQIRIPESFYNPVVVRIVAKAGNFSDGEENTLPLVTNRMLVTETLPLPLSGNEEKIFSLDKLLQNNSNTLAHRSLTVEYTANPAWYAVQALPYLMEYPYECAEQTFNRYYANALAGFIVAKSPKVAKIFEQWQTKDTAALLSNLQKNQELKTALLEETPWVLEAQNEQQQKQQIAALFQTHKLSKELKNSISKLEKMMLPEGAFPWFKGMYADRYITQYIVTGIARLQHLGAAQGDAESIANKAIPYLDRQIESDYNNLIKYKSDLKKQQISNTQVQYLYMRSFYKQAIPASTKKAFDFYLQQATTYWSQFNPYLKGQIAIAVHRYNQIATAKTIMKSLSETAVNNPELGMYWKSMPRGYWWYEAPIEAQSLLIEAFAEVTNNDKAVNAMKTWLLKQKQTQNWQTTKATADACYALLLNGDDWLGVERDVQISLGSKTINIDAGNAQAGTGYFKETIKGSDVANNMGNIKVQVKDKAGNSNALGKDLPSWGAVYWQYFEEMDKITSAETPLKIKKQLYIERNTASGPVLTEITDGNQLRVGDKVKVRVVLQSDRDMEYIHLKDMRAACFEPVNVLSGYKYQNGLGYYESTKDLATHFFFDYLRKGTYVFEYPVFVTAKGSFSNGISTAQCMYAPEFSSHTQGLRVKVD